MSIIKYVINIYFQENYTMESTRRQDLLIKIQENGKILAKWESILQSLPKKERISLITSIYHDCYNTNKGLYTKTLDIYNILLDKLQQDGDKKQNPNIFESVAKLLDNNYQDTLAYILWRQQTKKGEKIYYQQRKKNSHNTKGTEEIDTQYKKQKRRHHK